MKLQKLILGTRGSALALAQSELFAQALKKIYPELEIEIQKIVTSGDRIQGRLLTQEGGKGLFVKEIEDALLRRKIDLAVHSLKDLPAKIPEALKIGCLPERLDAGDVLITRDGKSLQELSKGAVVGTSSLRRQVQLQRLRPDLRFQMLRGNIDTRIRKLKAGEFEAIVLARAGLKRLGVDLANAVDLAIVPHPGQGCLAIEIHIDNIILNELLQPLHHRNTELITGAERRVMEQLGGDCNLPLGVFGQIHQGKLALQAFVASPDGKVWLEEQISGPVEQSADLADRLAEALINKGAKDILL